MEEQAASSKRRAIEAASSVTVVPHKISCRNKHKGHDAPLKQAKLTKLDSPVKKIAQSVNDRRAVKLKVNKTGRPSSATSNEKQAASRKAVSETLVLSSDGESDEIAGPVKAKEIPQKLKQTKLLSSKKRPAPAQVVQNKMKGKRQKQSKIDFAPGPSRLSTPDSEEEAFRATQLEPEGQTRKARKAALTFEEEDSLFSEPESQVSRPLTILVEDEDSEDELITPARRRRRYMPPPDDPNSATQIKRSLTPDLDAYEDEEASDFDLDQRKLATKTTGRGRNAGKAQYRSALEKLKRRKAGLPSDSEPSQDEIEPNEASDDERHSLGSFEVSGDEDVEAYDPARGLEDLEADVPAEYHQPRDPLSLFKICCQWEILDLILPQGGLEPDRYFKTAIQWLRDRTTAKAEIAKSSIWRRQYVRALEHGPDLVACETGNLGYYCDACGRTNRIATYVVRFEGSRYDHVTLEDLGSDADSSEDDLYVDAQRLDDPVEERKRKERALRQEFNLGVNCFEKTEVVHDLYHLRKHLRNEIFDKLTDLGHFSVVEKYARSIMTHEQRIEQANQLTEELDSKKIMSRLWSSTYSSGCSVLTIEYKEVIDQGESYIVDPNAGKRRSKYVLG